MHDNAFLVKVSELWKNNGLEGDFDHSSKKVLQSNDIFVLLAFELINLL